MLKQVTVHLLLGRISRNLEQVLNFLNVYLVAGRQRKYM